MVTVTTYIPATTATHGPFRKVVGTNVEHGCMTVATGETYPDGRNKVMWVIDESGAHDSTWETLECGHRGQQVRYHCTIGRKRRCLACKPPEPVMQPRVRNPRTKAGDPKRSHLTVVES